MFAIGIGDIKNDVSWQWFMRRLFDVIGDVPELVFISNQYKLIKKVVFTVFSTAKHNIFFYHIQGNLKDIFKMEPKTWENLSCYLLLQ